MSGRRPELTSSASTYYAGEGASSYARSSRIEIVQRQMTERALELLQLPPNEPCLLLDVGCGTGVSSRVLHDHGHMWVGTDLVRDMLKVARQNDGAYDDSDEENEEDDDENEDIEDVDDVDDAGDDDSEYEEEEDSFSEDDTDEQAEGEGEGGHRAKKKAALPFIPFRKINRPFAAEVVVNDMGDGVPFRPGVFDGAVSISAVQWLCNVDKRGQIPQKRLRVFFQSLYNSLARGARAVLQFYPDIPEQTNIITAAAEKAGFGGGVIIDYPHSARARKHYLVIYAGLAVGGYVAPKPLGVDEETYRVAAYRGRNPREQEALDQEGIRVCKRERMERGRPLRRHMRGKERNRKSCRVELPDGSVQMEARPETNSRSWIKLKKEERRKHGVATKQDSKYTGRRRPKAF